MNIEPIHPKYQLFKSIIYNNYGHFTPVYIIFIFIVFIILSILFLNSYRNYNIKPITYICSLLSIFGIAVISISLFQHMFFNQKEYAKIHGEAKITNVEKYASLTQIYSTGANKQKVYFTDKNKQKVYNIEVAPSINVNENDIITIKQKKNYNYTIYDSNTGDIEIDPAISFKIKHSD